MTARRPAEKRGGGLLDRFFRHRFHVVISSISTFRMDGGEPHLPVLLSLASIPARNSFVRL